jgi:DNA topoisomerase-2
MDDSLMEDSIFDDGASDDFGPPAKAAKPKKVAAKAAAPKKAAGPAKPRGKAAGATAKPKAKAAPKKKAKAASDDENSDIEMDEAPLDDESLLADTPPKQKKAPAAKKPTGKPLANIANESFGMEDDDAAAAKPKKGGASSKYQMVSVEKYRARGSD